MPARRIRILLKTTIPAVEDDWHVGRFSRLADLLAASTDPIGGDPYEVVARNRRELAGGDDEDLRDARDGAFDQVWLIATDTTGALTATDAANLEAFRRRGGGLLLTRDHQDLGACLSKLGALGATQHFQSVNPESDPQRLRCDDLETPTISWPNYHSGRNGDLQPVRPAGDLHPLMRREDGRPLERLPAHPHEGAVGAPAALRDAARVVAVGQSTASGVEFNICVAVDEPGRGRAVADSSFHHFADYNWDPRLGCPSFVTEPAGDEVIRLEGALQDTHRYVRNIADWLAGGR